MNVPLAGGLTRTPRDAVQYAERVATAVAAGWNREHRPDGLHDFPWVDIPYSGSLYRAITGMTWTVGASDQKVAVYQRIGNTLRLQLEVQTSTVGGVLSTHLSYRVPNNWVPTRRQGGPFALADNGTALCGWWVVVPGERDVRFYRDPQAGSVYTASANNTAVVADMTFEVQ